MNATKIHDTLKHGPIKVIHRQREEQNEAKNCHQNCERVFEIAQQAEQVVSQLMGEGEKHNYAH